MCKPSGKIALVKLAAALLFLLLAVGASFLPKPGSGVALEDQKGTEIILPAAIHAAKIEVQRKVTVNNKSVKVATFNIHHGADTLDRQNLADTLETIKEMNADILFLTEVDVGRTRSGSVDQVAYLAEGAGYPNCYFAPSLQGYGTALLSKFPIIEAKKHRLPGIFGSEPRVLLDALLSLYDKELRLFGVHLALNARLRQNQVDYLLRLAFAEKDKYQVILGDFNATWDTPEIARFGQAGFVEAASHQGKRVLTFPAENPRHQIDYVFFSPELADWVTRVETPASTVSDHLPYLVQLEVLGLIETKEY